MTIKLDMSNRNFMSLGFGIQKLYEKITMSLQLWQRVGLVFLVMTLFSILQNLEESNPIQIHCVLHIYLYPTNLSKELY